MFVLPITPLAVLSLLFALLTLILSSYASYLDKKELAKIVEHQGNAAQGLLDEMEICYKKALLVQEMGQAVSSPDGSETVLLVQDKDLVRKVT